MRIAVFAHGFDSDGNGITQSLVAGARALGRRGHALMLALPRDKGSDGPEIGSLGASEGLDVLRLPSLPAGAAGGCVVIPTGVAALRCRNWRPDVVHTHTPFGGGLEALGAARLLGAPLIGTVHGSIGKIPGRGPTALTLPSGTQRYARWYYDRCDLVTSPSGAVIATMQRAGLEIPVRVVAHPLPLDPRPRAEGHSDRKRRLGVGGFTVVHVGRLDAGRRVEEIVHAIPALITRIPRLALTIVGRGPEETALRLLAEQLQVTSHVRFAGHLAGERLVDAYAASDVFVSMSRAETPDLRTLEAMAFGLPVIGARADGLLEHVDASCGVVVEPGNTDALVASILALHRDAGRAAALGARGWARAARFAPDPIAAEWEEVYAEVLARRHHQERAASSRVAPQPTAPGP